MTVSARAAACRRAAEPLVIEAVELDDLRSDEVLVRMVGSGICHTDLAARDQQIPVPLPAVLGHEGSGVVEQVGEAVRGLKPGDRVVMSFIALCLRRSVKFDHVPGRPGRSRALGAYDTGEARANKAKRPVGRSMPRPSTRHE